MKLLRILALAGLSAMPVVAQVSTPSGLVTALESATQGEVISLYGVDPVDCPELSMSQTWDGGKLIFSDSPESPTTRGMLYEDDTLTATTDTTNRIWVYHENDNSSEDMKFSVLIKNDGASAGTLTYKAVGMAGPSTDFPLVGELAFYRWLTNPVPTSVSIPAGGIVRLDTNFDTINVVKGDVLNGIWDYTFTQPHTVMICALNPSDNPITVGPTLSVLARDTHIRGSFAACNKVYNSAAGVTVDPTNGIMAFPVGGDSDVAVTGYDEAVEPPTLQTNTGNYGLLYRVHVETSSSNGDDLGFLVNPRGGLYCSAAFAEAGILSGGKFLIPANDGSVSTNADAAVLGEYAPGAGLQVWWETMPVADTAGPVQVVIVPY